MATLAASGYITTLATVMVQLSFLLGSFSLLQDRHHQYCVNCVYKPPTCNIYFLILFFFYDVYTRFNIFVPLTCTFLFIAPFIPMSLLSCTISP